MDGMSLTALMLAFNLLAVDSPKPSQAILVSSALDISWNASASEHRGQIDQDFTYRCSPNGKLSSAAGTDIYTDDSSICSAAVHAGLITTKSGGVVTIRMMPGESSYAGTIRNQVQTLDILGFPGSFMFVDQKSGELISDPKIRTINWNSNLGDRRGQLGQEFSYRCLHKGTVGYAEGTDIYTDRSSICTAAVHHGIISILKGGTFTIRIEPGQSSYRGTTKNRITTSSTGSWYGSFIFIK